MNRRLMNLALVSQLLAACGGGGGGGADAGVTPDAPPPADGPGAAPPGGMGTVYGIVTDIGTGARIAGATVSGAGQSATSDGQGSFTLAGLPAGEVTVAISARDYAP